MRATSLCAGQCERERLYLAVCELVNAEREPGLGTRRLLLVREGPSIISELGSPTASMCL